MTIDDILSPSSSPLSRKEMVLLLVVADSIRELHEVPSGVLYAAFSGLLDIHQYEAFIGRLLERRLIRKSNNLLTWIGGE